VWAEGSFTYLLHYLAEKGLLNFFLNTIKAREPRSGHDVTNDM
jgi:hypothetical protein